MGKDDSAAEEFGIDDPNKGLEEPGKEAQTGHEEGTGEGAPDEGQTLEPEKLSAGKFKNQEELVKAYQESEKTRSQLDQERVRLEAESKALSPVIQRANEIIDRETQPATPSLEERKQAYYAGIGENPFLTHAEALSSPEVKEVLKKAVEEVERPFIEQQNKDRTDVLIKEAKENITVEEGYPVNFKDHFGDIGRILEQRPWLKQDPSCLKLAYNILLEQNPELMKDWEPKKMGAGPALTHTEKGSGAVDKTGTKKSEEEKEWEEMVRSGPKTDSVLL